MAEMSLESGADAASSGVAIGGIVLIAGGMLLAIFHSPGVVVPASPLSGARHARAPVTARAADEMIPPVTYTAEALRDPMVSVLPAPTPAAQEMPAGALEGKAALPPAPVVQGLVWGGGRSQALIDGQVYDVGDMIGQAKILAVTRQGVTVSIAGAHYVWQPVQPLDVSATLQGGQP